MPVQSQSNETNNESTQRNTPIQEEEEKIPPPPPLDDDDFSDVRERISPPTIVYRNSWGARSPRGRMEELKLPVDEVLVTFTGSEQCLSNQECLELVDTLQRRDMQIKALPDIQYKKLKEAINHAQALAQLRLILFLTEGRYITDKNIYQAEEGQKNIVVGTHPIMGVEIFIAFNHESFLIGGDGVVYEGRELKYSSEKDPLHADLKGKSIDIAYIGDFKDSVPLLHVVQSCAGLIQFLVENNYVSGEFNLTSLARSQTVYDKGDGCKGEECFGENHEDVQWHKFPGFKSLDEMLEKNLF